MNRHIPPFKDIAGQRFGRLLAVRRVRIEVKRKERRQRTKWECLCDCGNHVFNDHCELVNGKFRSCGCLRLEESRKRMTQMHKEKRMCKPDAARNDVMRSYTGGAKARNLAYTLSGEEFDGLTAGLCFYCGGAPSTVCKTQGGSQFIYNGIDRLNSSVGYEAANCVSCCRLCNRMKMDAPASVFILKCLQIVDHQIAKKVLRAAK